MNKYTLTALSILLTINIILGQSKTSDFELIHPSEKVPNSLYKTIRLLDSRMDTTHMGVVQVGLFNAKARVIPKIPFSRQLQEVVDALCDSAAGNGELLLQMRQFSFAEVTKSTSERGYCFIRFILYAKQGDSYRKIDALDTILVTKALDVTKLSAKKASQTITDFLAKNLPVAQNLPAAGTHTSDSANSGIAYNYYQLTRLDSIEKRNIKLYNTTVYIEGVYKTYETFRNQVPDYPTILRVGYDSGLISTIRIPGKSSKGEKLKNSKVYGIVYHGKPYVSTEFGYYPLDKVNDDFIFFGKTRMAPTAGEMITAQIMLGLLGQLLIEGDAVMSEMKIDHITGAFIRIRETR